MPEFSAYQSVMTTAFLVALLLGGISAKTNFCTMGAVSDWVNIGDLTRLRAWLLAMLVAVLGVQGLQLAGLIDLTDTRIPYRSAVFYWPRYLLGGLMFGIGMTLAGGCAKKNLIRIGGGNLKSVLVLLVAATAAWAMMKTRLFSAVFLPWIQPLSPDLRDWGLVDQGLDTVLATLTGVSAGHVSIALALTGLSVILLLCLRSRVFWHEYWQWTGALAVGLAVCAGWYITAGPTGQLWIEDALFMEQPPYALGQQSYTFISAYGETVMFLQPGQPLSFGVAALAGVICGSFLYHLLSRNLRLEWFQSWADVFRHFIGAILMGVGGVLGLGCTIGQGVTGLSTLATGSVLTLLSILLGSALSMKIMLYRMVYETSGFLPALLSSLVDLRMLPATFRRLDKI